nr:hypothetical protein [Tanacetum cinerariifolium]
MQTQTSNTLHYAIMEAGSKDLPPMLAPGNYVQCKSRIKRYIDTKPNHELIHYCLTNPPYELGWKDKEVPTSEGSLITTTERVHETYKNEFFDSEEVTSSAGIASLILKENFKDYKLETYRSSLLKYLDILAKCIDKRIYKYYEILVKEREVKEIKETGKLLNKTISHEHEIQKSFKLQSKDVLINSVQAVDASLVVTKSSGIEFEFFDSEEVTSSAGIASLILKENFKDYKLETYRSILLKYLDILAKCIDKRVYKYYEILVKEREVKEIKETGKLLNKTISHEHEIQKSFKLQSKDVLINSVQAVDASLVVTKSSGIEFVGPLTPADLYLLYLYK